MKRGRPDKREFSTWFSRGCHVSNLWFTNSMPRIPQKSYWLNSISLPKLHSHTSLNIISFSRCHVQNAATNDFSTKGNILISRRYQLRTASAITQCPNSNTNAHSQKRKKNYKKEKTSYSDLLLVAADQTPPRQYQKSIFSKSDTSKKGTVHKRRCRPDHRP
jgi:hypothetical protein